MVALNQEKFTVATDDTTEGQQNGTKNNNTNKSKSFGLNAWKTC